MQFAIFGCGGVGSRVAELLARRMVDNSHDIIHLIDFDYVEEKNIARQMFKRNDAQSMVRKTMGCRYFMNDIVPPNSNIFVHNRKVESSIDCEGIFIPDPSRDDKFAVITTDNISSKVVIAQWCNNMHIPYLIANCDKNTTEIKSFLSEEDIKAWDMGGGYSNNQDIISNVLASLQIYQYIIGRNIEHLRIHKTIKNIDNVLMGDD